MTVVDASALVNVLVDDPVSVALVERLSEAALHAPAVIDFEVASALRGHAIGGRLDAAELTRATVDFAAIALTRYPLVPLMDRVLELRDNFTVYDASYIALAEALDAPIVTADSKLAEARRLGVVVEVIPGGG